MFYGMMILINNIFLAICSYTDIKSRKISMKVCIIFAMAYMTIQLLSNNGLLWITGVVPGVLLLFVALVSGQKIGYGDGVMVLVSGIGSGITLCIDICSVAMLLSGVTALVLFLSKKKSKDDSIPFAPFVFAGNVVITILCIWEKGGMMLL